MLQQDQQCIEKNKKAEVAAALLGVFIGIITWLTVLSRSTIHNSSFAFQPFHSFQNIIHNIKEYGFGGNFFGNIILFLPIGILFPVVFNKGLKRTAMFGISLSLLIELSQFIFHKGYFEVDDLICNTIGVCAGFLIQKSIKIGIRS